MEIEHFRQILRDFLLDTDGNTSELALFNSGILKQASDLGMEEALLRRHIALISRDIRWNRFDEIKEEIKDLAVRRRKLLTEADKEEIIRNAAQIDIRREYVLEKLIPQVLGKVPIIEILNNTESEKTYTFLRKKLDEKGYVKSEEVTALFELLANENNESHIIGAVETFLDDHKLTSTSPKTGTTARTRLTSADWRVVEAVKEEKIDETKKTVAEEKKNDIVPVPDENEALPEASVIIQKAVINYFKSTSTEIMLNEKVDISWEVSNATVVHISGIGNNLPPRGKRSITPPHSTDYVLKVPPDTSVSATLSVTVKEFKAGFSFEKMVLWVVIAAILGSGYVIYDDYQSKNQSKLPAYLKTENGISDITCNEYADLDTNTQKWGEWKPYDGGIRFFINARSIRIVTPKETDVLTITSTTEEDYSRAVINCKNKKGIAFEVEHAFDTDILLFKYENETVKFRPKP
ncbi:hypothetical protein [Runella sp.]|uniref:hypothetical protein n=1 Tax=Runella sp. TaxID=1960881 RepID=UPI003D13461E